MKIQQKIQIIIMWIMPNSITLLLLAGCGIFGSSSSSQASTISEPPQKVSQKDANLVIANRNTDTSQRSKNIENELEEDKEKEERQPRIQEERNPNGGEVEEIKVRNKNLPSYYIYPAKKQNWGITQIPDQNISTPNWQISW
jgi:hypothetical protein